MPRPEPPPRPSRRRRRPVVEGLEARELMSHVPAADLPLPNRPTLTPSSYGPPTPGHGPFSGPLIPDGSPDFINRIQQQVYPNSTPYPGSASGVVPLPSQPASLAGPDYNPTPAEQSREYFESVSVGRYTVTPGRFSNQGYTIHAFSKKTSSNQFLKARAQLLMFTPAVDPATVAGPLPAFNQAYAATNGAYTGLAVFVPYNALQTSNELVLDLGPRQTTETRPVGGLDLPTRITWSLDPNGVGGFTSAPGFTQGGGTLRVDYTPDRTPRGGAIQSGTITYAFQGLINTSSALNSIESSLNEPGSN